MSNLTKKIFVVVGVSFLLVSCGARTTCDAYSYIQNKSEKQLNHEQEIKKNPIQKEKEIQITHVEYETI